ncbi:hypothetical protein F5Y12DRAFT_783568 [Xylaria sp. FL1777]|nr:hypothetical protein F5Y12DRAFT_783568 [Xylaria sp. FL1777]
MAQTRAQGAPKRGRNPEDPNQDAPTRKRQRLKTYHNSSKEPPAQAIEDTRDLGTAPSLSLFTADDTSGSTAACNVDPNNLIDFWRKEGRWPGYDQKPREKKSAQYRDQRYDTLLATKGSFIVKSKLDRKQIFPEDSLFSNNFFDSPCQKIHNRNKARVIQDIFRLIVPSAESLTTRGTEHLEILTESVNDGWNNSIPLVGTRPQPGYSVGFRRGAFTKEQLETSEVKCGAEAVDVAERRNAHTVVELCRPVGREDEVHRQILAFSVSHDHRLVRIHGHCPVINKKETEYYCHPIHTFDITVLDGKDKWTAYQVTNNIYDTWMLDHFKRICSAIDQLPSKVNFNVQALSESTGLSQGLEHLAASEAESASPRADEDGQSKKAGQVATPPGASFSPEPANGGRT